MDLLDLDELIINLGIDPTKEQLNLMYLAFKRDFIDSVLVVEGLRVKVVLHRSQVDGLEDYPETFVHLITRKSVGGKRVFDRHRANKIHWIKSILENRNEDEILYFEYLEGNGKIRDYYWFKEGGFLIIMEKITPDYLVITSFNVDDKRNEEYFERRYNWYRKYRA